MGKIIVKIQLKGPLKKYGQDADIFEFQVDRESIIVHELMKQLKVPISSISFILIDGNKTDLNATIRRGEIITVNPRVAGG